MSDSSNQGLLNSALAAIVAVVVLAGCDQEPGNSTSKTAEIAGATTSAADDAWKTLTSSGVAPDRIPGESSLAYFMRQVETSNIRRRELGLEFWSRYPDDPRRYKWLLLTVHMPPYYADDIVTWSENETKLTPNAAPVNTDLLSEWRRKYEAMRDEFWNAPETTERDRCILWFGELEQELLRISESMARGEAVEASSVVGDSLEFFRRFPKPLDVHDTSGFFVRVRTLIELVIHTNREVLGLDTDESLSAYLSAVGETGNEFAQKAAEEITATSDFVEYRLPSTTDESVLAWAALPEFPLDQPVTLEEWVIFYHDMVVNTRKNHEIGARRLWYEYPDRKQQLEWIVKTQWNSTTYAEHFVDAIWELARGKVVTDSDETARAEWNRLYAKLRSELWADKNITEEERGRIRGAEVWSQLWRARDAWLTKQDKETVQQLLDDINALFTNHDAAHSAIMPSSIILSQHRDFGLDDDELLAFFKPMLSRKNESLWQLAEAAYRLVELRTTPFEFVAQTLYGEEIDVAKDFSGKIVLVDHWTTTCSSCIRAMPRIHEAYERFKEDGFEVVSIVYDGTTRRSMVRRVEEELGLTWTTLDGESQREAVERKYGYNGYPQYMLLNRDGTLRAGTGEVDMGRNLETLLDEMLAAEADGKETATVH